MSIILPKNWTEITILQLYELNSETFNNLEGFLSQLSILSGMDNNDEEFYYLTNDDLKKYRSDLSFLSTPIPYHMSNYMELDGVEYKMINFDMMLVAEWITLEHYITTNFKTHAAEIMAVVWRRYTVDEFGEERLESFDFDFNRRVAIMLHATIDFYPIKKLLEHREHIYNTNNLNIVDYEDIDEDEVEEHNLLIEEEEENHTLNYRERAKKKEEEEKKQIHQVYNWERILLNLANDDSRQAYELLSVPISWVFNIISMKNSSISN